MAEFDNMFATNPLPRPVPDDSGYKYFNTPISKPQSAQWQQHDSAGVRPFQPENHVGLSSTAQFPNNQPYIGGHYSQTPYQGRNQNTNADDLSRFAPSNQNIDVDNLVVKIRNLEAELEKHRNITDELLRQKGLLQKENEMLRAVGYHSPNISSQFQGRLQNNAAPLSPGHMIIPTTNISPGRMIYKETKQIQTQHVVQEPFMLNPNLYQQLPPGYPNSTFSPQGFSSMRRNINIVDNTHNPYNI